MGTYYEARAKTSPYIDGDIEAGRHLFQAGEYDRSYELLGGVSDWPQARGRVREGLHLLEPFLAESVREAMTPDRVGGVLGTVGNACLRLGQVERSIGFYEQALIIDRAIGDRQGEGTALGTWASPTPAWARWSGPSTSWTSRCGSGWGSRTRRSSRSSAHNWSGCEEAGARHNLAAGG
ncbi:MAG: tetratricopeptide repeat protein [Isosphaeraceae bacterium]